MSDASSASIIRNLRDRIETLEGRLAAIRKEYNLFELPGLDGLKLTTSERMLCKILYDGRGRPIGRGHLYDALYGLKPEADWAVDKIIDVFICKIRRRLRGTRWEILTIYGVGYQMNEKEEASRNGV